MKPSERAVGEVGYDIRLYTPEMMPQVVDLMVHLWAQRPEVRDAYFRWKYVENPYAEPPPGIVALYQGRAVGFRGYFALRYEIPGSPRNLTVLCAGDTCVHPDHRRKGLSVSMGNLAMDAFAGTYEIFLNMTATFASMPGYLKMGFQPLAKRAYVSLYSLAGFAKYVITHDRRPQPRRGKITFGKSNWIQVSDRPEPERMSALCSEQKPKEHQIRLSKDLSFFRWRFGNVTKKYVFYYHYVNDQITGYVVVGLSPNHRRGYILDFADTDGRSVVDILGFILQQRAFDILSIYDFCLSDAFRKDLKGLRFKTTGLVRRIEKKRTGELPLLIRPVKRNDTENDWTIENLDIRKIENWKIMEVCSDAV
jgi:GNAT superfamily N-acetyltransferase